MHTKAIAPFFLLCHNLMYIHSNKKKQKNTWSEKKSFILINQEMVPNLNVKRCEETLDL